MARILVRICDTEYFYHLLTHISSIGILWSHGETWVSVRTFTKKILKEFGYGKLKIMDASLLDSANHLVDGIKTELLDSRDGILSIESQKFSIHVVNVLWNLLGGYKFDSNDELVKKNMECVNKVVGIIGHGNPYNLFPFLKVWFPKRVHYPEHLKIHSEIHEFTKVTKLKCVELVIKFSLQILTLQALINDAKEKRSQRLDTEPISFIEVFLDKIENHREDTGSIFTRNFNCKFLNFSS